MENTEENKSKVVVIDSLQSWEFHVNQASNQNSPVSQSLNVFEASNEYLICEFSSFDSN